MLTHTVGRRGREDEQTIRHHRAAVEGVLSHLTQYAFYIDAGKRARNEVEHADARWLRPATFAPRREH